MLQSEKSHLRLSARSHSASVWVAEAIHRANNFSQMALIRNIGPDKGRVRNGRIDPVLQRLCDAYNGLIVIDPVRTLCPCKELLGEIATGLVRLFGQHPCEVQLHLNSHELILDREDRRALLLLTSELIVNAIKHGFQGRSRGEISVALTVGAMNTVLTVMDDGIGLGHSNHVGTGTKLIGELCRMLGARLKCIQVDGYGSCMLVHFPKKRG